MARAKLTVTSLVMLKRTGSMTARLMERPRLMEREMAKLTAMLKVTPRRLG